MAIELCRRLQRDWFPDGGSDFQTAVNNSFDQIGFSDQYVESCLRVAEQRKSKVVKDGVWGMIELDWRSIRLLDAPLVQRLRGIKQLGFSYLTYPSAEHSRFIHSLGMYCVVSRFIAAMRRDAHTQEPQRDPDPRIQRHPPDDTLERDLLHAAILHDIGHMPFSHASENVLDTHREAFHCGPKTVDEVLFDVSDALGRNLKLSECLSLVFILSPRFRRFYDGYVRPGEEDQNTVLRIAALISGLRPGPNLRGAADLISATAIDADKVDYICRDAAACGIPVGIDVARLFLRSAFYRLPREILRKLLTDHASIDDPDTIFVVNASGADTIEELAQARAALYQRVYLHQTTRNAERILHRCFEVALAENRQGQPLELGDALKLWSMDDFALLRRVTQDVPREVAALGARLLYRRLPKRACAFGRNVVTTLTPIRHLFPSLPQNVFNQVFRQIVGLALEDLQEERLSGDKLHELESDIAREASTICRMLRPAAADVVPATDIPDLVTILPMPNLEGARKDCIVLENNEFVRSPRSCRWSGGNWKVA